jgi:hypothetical protein
VIPPPFPGIWSQLCQLYFGTSLHLLYERTEPAVLRTFAPINCHGLAPPQTNQFLTASVTESDTPPLSLGAHCPRPATASQGRSPCQGRIDSKSQHLAAKELKAEFPSIGSGASISLSKLEPARRACASVGLPPLPAPLRTHNSLPLLRPFDKHCHFVRHLNLAASTTLFFLPEQIPSAHHLDCGIDCPGIPEPHPFDLSKPTPPQFEPHSHLPTCRCASNNILHLSHRLEPRAHVASLRPPSVHLRCAIIQS